MQTAKIGNLTFYNADNLEIMRGMKDNEFDLAICDIPYGIGVTKMAFLKETKTTVRQRNGSRLNPHKSKKIHAVKDWDSQTPLQIYFDELKRVSKNQIIFGAHYTNWK